MGNTAAKSKAFTWSATTNKAVYGVNSFQSSGYAIRAEELESIQSSLDRWSQFLRNVFLGSSLGYVSRDSLDQLALEDTELYLDVKIQISQALASIQDDILANRMEMICNSIRKNSYQFLTNSLPRLNENSRQMVERKNQTGFVTRQSNQALLVGTASSSGDRSEISVKRKQILATINRQHRDVIHQLAELNKKIANNLYSEEYEM